MASAEDESRYGRMSLLVLNIGPIVLRQVIDNQCTVATYRDFEDALNSKIHSLFHLLFRNCCCGNVSNRTILTKHQWDLLYIRVPAPLPHRPQGECPCYYKAIPGVTSGVMDVTLCCVILRNLLPGMSLTDVDTIRTVRNDLIHANSACLDSATFQTVWSTVSQALSNLSQFVSPTCFNDTTAALKRLKERVIDPTELQALADIMKDNRQYEDLRDNINRLQAVQLSNEAEKQVNTKRIEELQSQLQRAETGQRSHEIRVQNIIENELQSQLQRIETQQRSQYTHQRFHEIEYRKTTRLFKLKLRRQERQVAIQRIFSDDLAQDLQLQEHQASQRIDNLDSEIQNIQQQASDQRITTDKLASNLHQQGVIIAEIQSAARSQQPGMATEDCQDLQDNLVNSYHNATQCIPVTPLGKATLPLSILFSPVVVEDNTKLKKVTEKEIPKGKKIIERTAEMFFNEGKPVERIFMKGEAGRGKTVYGLKLTEEWCKVKQGVQSDMQVVSQFEFLFHVSMRYVEPDRTKVVDMICDSLSKGDDRLIRLIKRVLCDNDIRCLVVLDGLDEWSTNSDEFPNTYGLVNCVLFTTTRPWKLEKLQLDYTPRDKVVEILGINPMSTDTLIKCIVTELYGSDDRGLTHRLISYCEQRARDPKMKELMKLPMILIASCYVWCEEETDDSEPRAEKNADKSMTYFSLALVDMLIQRAEKKNKEVKDYFKKHCNEQTVPKSTTHSMMALLCEFFPKIFNFLDILIPLCKVAHDDIMSKQTHLVFRREKLENEIGTSTVELALKVGIISQCWAPGRGFNIQNVSVSFFHKLIQEIMAAMYITWSPDGIQTFCDQCHSLDKVLDLSNVFMFISGLDSSLGYHLSQHVVHVAQTDQVVVQYRQTMDEGCRNKVRRLYDLQLSCYKDMLHVTRMMDIPHQPCFQITDVYLDHYPDSEVIGKMISNTYHTVVSIWLCVPNRYISGLLQYLPQHSKSLSALSIERFDVQSCELLVTMLPQFTQLQCIRYYGEDRDVDVDVVAALAGLSRLKTVKLWGIT